MDFDASNDRPFKKRRFFVDDPFDSPQSAAENTPNLDASLHASSLTDVNDGLIPTDTEFSRANELEKPGQESPEIPDLATSAHQPQLPVQQDTRSFDTEAFVGIIGEDISPEALLKIQKLSGGNLESAINIYFDGSWKNSGRTGSNQTTLLSRERIPSQPAPSTRSIEKEVAPKSNGASLADENVPRSKSQPPRRYVGAFGVGAWATRSGTGLVKHGDTVNIERARSQPLSTRGRTGKIRVNNKGDVLTRFTNDAGQEIGRLPRETAEWVSTLLDQKICEFRGVCVFAPDRLRVNDTVFLQLLCFMRIEAFQPKVLHQTADDNRATTIFEQEESTEEKQLRLRQVALVQLFDEIGLKSTTQDDEMKKQRKEGLLRAAEMADEEAKKTAKSGNNDTEEDEPGDLEDAQLDALYKKAQSFDFSMPEAQPPSSFAMDLRKYQKQALYWMLSKEKDKKSGREVSMHPLWEEYSWPLKDVDDKDLPVIEGIDHFYVNPYSGELSLDFPAQEQHCLGGILADEMGLGKTIEMLSLVHSHRNVPPIRNSGDLTRLPTSGVVPGPYTTLVVAPMSLLAQWESEALKASKEGTMKVLVYYGNEKSVNLRELCSAGNAAAPNVVVTSYGVVMSEHRAHQALTPGASWTPGNLFSVDFFRIILDEAHLIKNRRSKTARACYDLKATHRWVLTGTPIVNRLEDLFSLVRFLKVEPWNNFSFWKTFITTPFENKEVIRAISVVQTVLEPLVLRRTKFMKTPEGEPLVPLPKRTIQVEEVELHEQEREIYNHIFTRAKQTFNSSVEAGTVLKSYSTIFAQLTRLRQTCCHPILTRKKEIVADEEDAAAAADLNNDLKDDMDLQELINRFTTTTENADSNEPPDPSSKFTAHALRQIQTDSSGECPICSEEPMIDPAVTACWHSACKKCLEDYIKHQTDKGVKPRCFSCRADLSLQDIFEVVRHQSPNSTPTEQQPPPSSIDSNDLYSSSQPPPRISIRRINPLSPSAHTSAKIHALLSHLTRLPPGTKSVVFSQFTTFIDLIGPQLTKAGISHVRFDGTMSQKARAEIVAQFSKTETFTQEELDQAESTPTQTPGLTPTLTPKTPKQSSVPPAPTVLLISLGAGGVGLNLTAASNVYMMHPWWSFATEAQAIDRVHRMGQLRDVNVVRFIVKDSIEGRMLRVQERKMGIAGSLGLKIGGNEDDKKKERIEELKLLFE
ncbi:DEAD/DEAH box helicase [Aspergillus mulundensis]|uniref:DNA repair protein rad5 n=1 Tax=Aspergillus mulundensis TaxID=1810919 RepID=A0A3D8QML0_9EURO|nr:DNA repair protein rad5 [Aspergillus mulundensis]RDW63029.1 DNA repair protein rad5 [Aspergillus mulundensis]